MIHHLGGKGASMAMWPGSWLMRRSSSSPSVWASS